MATEQVIVVVTDNGTANVVANNLAKVGTAADRSVGSVAGLNGALTMLASAFAISKVVDAIDTFSNLDNRLKALKRTNEDAGDTFNKLFDIAQKTRSPFEATVNTYIRLDTATRTLGLSTEKTMKIVETLNKGLVIGGASAQETSAVLTQFAQGIGSGKFGGDELKSFAENATYMADRVAKAILGTNGTTAALREMGAKGKLTAQVVAEAMLKVSEDVTKTFDKIPLTIGGAMTKLSNSFNKFIYDTSNANGAGRTLADTIEAIANNITPLANGLMTAAAAYGAYRTALLLASIAQGGFNALVMMNPYVAVVATIAAVVTWLLTYGATIKLAADKTETLADVTRTALGVVGKAFYDAGVYVWSWVTAIFNATVTAYDYISNFGKSVWDVFASLWARISYGWNTFWGGVKDIWEGVKSYFNDWINWIWEKMQSVISLATRIAAVVGTAGGITAAGAAPLAPMNNLRQFANGGSFEVGGGGGTDSQTVAFKASPGEQVTINNPGVTPGQTINVINNQTGGNSGFGSVRQAEQVFTKPINELGGTFTEVTTETAASSTTKLMGGYTAVGGRISDTVVAQGIYGVNAQKDHKASTDLLQSTNHNDLTQLNGSIESYGNGMDSLANQIGMSISNLGSSITQMGGQISNSIQQSVSALDGAIMNTANFKEATGGTFDVDASGHGLDWMIDGGRYQYDVSKGLQMAKDAGITMPDQFRESHGNLLHRRSDGTWGSDDVQEYLNTLEAARGRIPAGGGYRLNDLYADSATPQQNTTLNVTVVTKDFDSFRRSEKQIAQDMLRTISKA